MKYSIEITDWDNVKQVGSAVSTNPEHGDIIVMASSFVTAQGLARAKPGKRYEANVNHTPYGRNYATNIEDREP